VTQPPPVSADTAGSSPTPGPGPGWRGLYLTGGASGLAFVVLFLTALALDAVAPPPVTGAEATLRFIAAHKPVYIAEQVLWILPNILAVLVFVALFVAVYPRNRSLALVATVIGTLSWASFLAIPVTSRGSLVLVTLSDRYTSAPAGDRRAVTTAAEALIAENNTPAVVGVLSTVGILLISLALRGGGFPRALVWLGVATGVSGIVGEALRHAVPQFYLAYGLLLWAWFAAAGTALVRLGRRTPRRPPTGGRA
jgi:hypothetical protein